MAVHFARGLTHQCRGDGAGLPRVGAEERAVAADVDDPRDARRQTMHFAQGAGSEDLPRRPGDAKPVAYIALRLVARQRSQVIPAGDALGKLTQIVAIQQLTQLRLADQDDLQKLLRGSFQIGEQAHLFEHVRGEILRLIDDDDDAPPLGMRRQQPVVEGVDHLFHAVAVRGLDRQPQFLADRQQEFHRRDAGIQDHRNVGMMGDARQQRPYDRGLAGSHLAGQLDETAGLVDAV